MSPELFLRLLDAVDVDERYHSTVDLVIRGPVRPYPDGIPAAVVVFDFYFLGGNAVYYIGNQRAHVGGLRVHIDVDNGTSDVSREQVEHLLCMGVKRRIRRSLPSMMIGRFALTRRFVMSSLTWVSSTFRFCNSSLTVVSSSFVD